MICVSCRMAGGLLKEADVIFQHLDGREQETMAGPEAAALVHRACRGGTWCDCAHTVPIRRPAVTPTLNK